MTLQSPFSRESKINASSEQRLWDIRFLHDAGCNDASAARILGISPEWVRVLRGKLNLPVQPRLPRPSHPCADCGVILPNRDDPVRCLGCRANRKAASRAASRVLIICESCGKPCYSRKWDFLRNKHHFCSKHCAGVWVGKTYGFGVHRRFFQQPDGGRFHCLVCGAKASVQCTTRRNGMHWRWIKCRQATCGVRSKMMMEDKKAPPSSSLDKKTIAELKKLMEQTPETGRIPTPAPHDDVYWEAIRIMDEEDS